MIPPLQFQFLLHAGAAPHLAWAMDGGGGGGKAPPPPKKKKKDYGYKIRERTSFLWKRKRKNTQMFRSRGQRKAGKKTPNSTYFWTRLCEPYVTKWDYCSLWDNKRVLKAW